MDHRFLILWKTLPNALKQSLLLCCVCFIPLFGPPLAPADGCSLGPAEMGLGQGPQCGDTGSYRSPLSWCCWVGTLLSSSSVPRSQWPPGP